MEGDNVIAYVETARKAKAPIVGIPIEGSRPFAVRRDLLVESLKGLTIIEAAIQMPLNGTNGERQLVIYAVAPGIKARRVFYPAPLGWQQGSPQYELPKWADAERKKRALKAAQPKLTTREKAILRLEKQLAKLPEHRLDPLEHPLLEGRAEYERCREHEREAIEQVQQHRQRCDGCGLCGYIPATAAQLEARWRREKATRREVQKLARACGKGEMTTAQLYKRLEGMGLKVKKWSQLDTHTRRQVYRLNPAQKEQYVCAPEGDLHDYLASLWRFCDLLTERPREFRREDVRWQPPIGAARYANWLGRRAERQQLQSQIEAIRMMEAA
jgi:hypothetical protein